MIALAVTLSVAAGAASQAVTGFGFSMVAGPSLIVALTPLPGVRLVNVLSSVVNVVLLVREWRAASPRAAAGILTPAIVAIPFVAIVAKHADRDVLSAVAGLVIIASAGVLAKGVVIHSLRGRAGMVLAGAVGGAGNVLSGVGGPAVAMYAVNAGWPARMTRPTLQLFFLGINAVTLLSLGLPDVSGLQLLGLAVTILVGFEVGTAFARRIDDAAVRRLVLTMAIAGGLAAVLRGVL